MTKRPFVAKDVRIAPSSMDHRLSFPLCVPVRSSALSGEKASFHALAEGLVGAAHLGKQAAISALSNAIMLRTIPSPYRVPDPADAPGRPSLGPTH